MITVLGLYSKTTIQHCLLRHTPSPSPQYHTTHVSTVYHCVASHPDLTMHGSCFTRQDSIESHRQILQRQSHAASQTRISLVSSWSPLAGDYNYRQWSL